jgi:integrase
MKGRHIAARKFKSSVFSGGGCVLLPSWVYLRPALLFDPFPQFLLYGLHRRREPAGHMRVMARSVFMCLGLRVSELLGLQWRDVDWDNLLLTVERAYVLGQVDEVKTIYSERRVPLDPALGEILLSHKRAYAPDAEGSVWMFPNPDTGRPWWPHQIQQHYIRKAGMEVLHLDHIGWHTFRHSYSSLLRELGVDVKVQQVVASCRYPHHDESVHAGGSRASAGGEFERGAAGVEQGRVN